MKNFFSENHSVLVTKKKQGKKAATQLGNLLWGQPQVLALKFFDGQRGWFVLQRQ